MRLALILLLIGLSAASLILLIVRSHFADQRKRARDRANAQLAEWHRLYGAPSPRLAVQLARESNKYPEPYTGRWE